MKQGNLIIQSSGQRYSLEYYYYYYYHHYCSYHSYYQPEQTQPVAQPKPNLSVLMFMVCSRLLSFIRHKEQLRENVHSLSWSRYFIQRERERKKKTYKNEWIIKLVAIDEILKMIRPNRSTSIEYLAILQSIMLDIP